MRSRRLPISSILRDRAFPSLHVSDEMLFLAQEYLPEGYSGLYPRWQRGYNRHIRNNHRFRRMPSGHSLWLVVAPSRRSNQHEVVTTERSRVAAEKVRLAPGISLWGVVGQTNFMRFSLMKAAHAALDGAAYRKSGYPRISCEVWMGQLTSCGFP